MSSDLSFEAIARRWYAQQVDVCKPVNALDVMRRMEGDLFPDQERAPAEAACAVGLQVCQENGNQVREPSNRCRRCDEEGTKGQALFGYCQCE